VHAGAGNVSDGVGANTVRVGSPGRMVISIDGPSVASRVAVGAMATVVVSPCSKAREIPPRTKALDNKAARNPSNTWRRLLMKP